MKCISTIVKALWLLFIFAVHCNKISTDKVCVVGNVKRGVKGKTAPLKELSTKNYFRSTAVKAIEGEII